MTVILAIDPDRLHRAITEIAAFNDDPAAGGVTREVFTPTYTRACEHLITRMQEAGLSTRVDSFGNVFGRWPGTEPDAPYVLTGSHIDTTLNAGRYDGVVGVLGALEALALLRDGGVRPRRSIEIVAFAGEEPRFGLGCIGSRAAAGELTRPQLDELRDRSGITLAAALRDAGHDPDALAQARLDPASVHAFIELHIEQGSVLEQAGIPIGVVTHIAAPHDVRLTVRGEAMHSGATPMDLRRDALVGAAEMVLTVERLARESSSATTVGTVGVLDVAPGAINVVPGTVVLDVDIRDRDLDAREAVVDALLAEVARIADRRGLTVAHETIANHPPAACHPIVVDAAREAAIASGRPHREMASGAYHDAMVLGSLMPMGMLFVPSEGGVSHSPLERTDPTHIAQGAEVLAGTLERLAR